MSIGLLVQMTEEALVAIVFSLDQTSFHGHPLSRKLFQGAVRNLSIVD